MAVRALWDWVYDYESDHGGGFVSGQFLLRDDGVLLSRTGHSSTGGGQTRFTFHEWEPVHWYDGPADPLTAFRTAKARGYDLATPGPTPVDASTSGPYPGSPALARWVTEADCATWTAPGGWEPQSSV